MAPLLETTMKRILVVDDDPQIVRLHDRSLAKQGYEVVTAKNGLEALAILDVHRDIDLVVSDIEIPQCDGVTMCERVRDKGYDGLVILISAMDVSRKDDKTVALVARISALRHDGILFQKLGKPCKPKHLAEVVKTALSK